MSEIYIIIVNCMINMFFFPIWQIDNNDIFLINFRNIFIILEQVQITVFRNNKEVLVNGKYNKYFKYRPLCWTVFDKSVITL